MDAVEAEDAAQVPRGQIGRAVSVQVDAVRGEPVEAGLEVDEGDVDGAARADVGDRRRDLGVEGDDRRPHRRTLPGVENLAAGRGRKQRAVEVEGEEIVGCDGLKRAARGLAGGHLARRPPERRDAGHVGKVGDRHRRSRAGERVEELVKARAELRGRELHGRRIGPGRHVEHVVVADPHEQEARLELPGSAQLRHGAGAEREPEDQKLEQVAARDVVVPDDGTGDVARSDPVEDAGSVLARHGEVPDPSPGRGAEADAGPGGSTHLPGIEGAVLVVVEDGELGRDARPVHERLGERHVRASGENCGRTVDLPGAARRDETPRAEARQKAVADHDQPPQPRRRDGPTGARYCHQQNYDAERRQHH